MVISTYLGFATATKDMTATLARVARQATVKSDQQYYDDNIGKVKTVDDFMDDYKLYSYAMKAYGLEDMTYAKGFMKKVLTSDLSDTSSFANKLTDTRYKQFAAAFNFGTTTGQTAQSDTQESDTIGLYEQSYANEATAVKTESSYYSAKIDKVTTVNDIVGNSRLKNYILQAYGVDPTYVSNSFLKNVLTSDVNDPNSFVNTASNFSTKDGPVAFKQIAAQFGFNADGTISGATAQTADQKAAVVAQYNNTVPTFTTTAAAASNDAYYREKIASVTSVSDITGDNRLFSYIKTAYGLDSDLSAFEFNLAFQDPGYASVKGMTSIVAKFNFDSSQKVPAGETAQTSDQIEATSKSYISHYGDAKKAAFKDGEANYKTMVAKIKTIDDFFAANASTVSKDVPTLKDLALQAYGIKSDEVSKAQLKKILESDPYDPKSYVNTLKDDRFVNLAKAFNFDSSGKLRQPVEALSDSTVNGYISAYSRAKTIGLTGPTRDKAVSDAKDAATYFATNIVKVKSVTDLLADKKLTDFILTANNIDPKTVDTATLKKALTSDPTDAKSFLNTADGAKFKSLVGVLNFDSKGNLTTSKLGTAQNEGARLSTDDLYLRQTLETQEGDTNDGVRLALYFQRKAPQIGSIYDIMSDTALYTVIKTAFSLPDSVSNQDVSQQATLLQKLVSVQDMRDPDKVGKLLQRFSALYDMKNNTVSSPAASILSGSGIGISADTLLSIAQLKAG